MDVFSLDRLDKSTPVQFDRWMVNIKNDRKFGLRRNKQIVMNNYFSIGCDALGELISYNDKKSRRLTPTAPGAFAEVKFL